MMMRTWLAAVLAALSLAAPVRAADAPDVEFTWMSIANWYIKIGDLRILLDGYVTRLPGPPFFFAPKSFPGDQYAYTKAPAAVDVAAVTKVREALLGNTKLDYVLSGHSHWDHSWDTPTWAKQAGGVMIDDGSAFRMQANVPLVIPEVNAEDIDWHEGILSIPNCTTTPLAMALNAMRQVAPLRRVTVATYQATSGTGAAAVEELRSQLAATLAVPEQRVRVVSGDVGGGFPGGSAAQTGRTTAARHGGAVEGPRPVACPVQRARQQLQGQRAGARQGATLRAGRGKWHAGRDRR